MPVLFLVFLLSFSAHAVEVNRRTFLGGMAASATGGSPITSKTLPAICADPALEARVAAIRKVWVSHHWFREFRNSPFDYSVIRSINLLKPEIGHDWPRYRRYKEWEATQKWEDVSRGMDERAETLLRYVAHTELRLAKKLNLPAEQIAEEVNKLLVNQLNWHGYPQLAPRKFAPLGEKFVETFLAEIEADYPFMAQYARACLAYVLPLDYQSNENTEETSKTKEAEDEIKSLETNQELAAVRARIINLIRQKSNDCLEQLTESDPLRNSTPAPIPQTAEPPNLQP